MLKFPRSLDEIDPLPCEIGTADRWIEEWERAIEREDGTDWKKIPGKLYWFRNGKGQLRYAPPLPPKTPKTLTPKRSYSWVGRREPKLGDFVKKVDWPNYYEVIAETDTHVTLEDKASRAREAYLKNSDWRFMVKADEIPPFQPGDTITLHWRHNSPTAKVVECVKYKDYWPRLHKAVNGPKRAGYLNRLDDWIVRYGDSYQDWVFTSKIGYSPLPWNG